MKRKLTFRYGLDLTARIGLLVWSSGWLVILGYMLYYGEINSGDSGGAITYYRDKDPVWFWGLACVAVAMTLLGLALTFELECTDPKPETNDERPATGEPMA